MPSIGTRHRSDNNLLITTRIYGPTNKFMFDPKDVLTEVKRITNTEQPPKTLAGEIANCVLDMVEYDPNVVAVECEVLQGDGILFTEVAELDYVGIRGD